ncbi:MAG: TonB-dependent receptor [Gammaproteobacteria bacterium]|nr:TonB-dependent receptor [Gammaproteobacteria bacterium]
MIRTPSMHLCMTSLVLAASVAAAETPTGNTRTSTHLDELVVTPTLTARNVAEVDMSVTLIDATGLQRQQPVDLAEVLRAQPGVDVVSNGGYGKATSLFIRGTSASQSLLLMDGARMGSATNGNPSWQVVPPPLIERIDRGRGPRGVIYGADASGGVVQVFTRRGHEDAGVWAVAGAGSFDSREYALGYGMGSERTSLSAAVNHFETDGIALRPGGERKGYDSTSFVLRGDTVVGNGLDLGATALRSQGSTAYIGGETDFVHQSLSLRAAVSAGEHWTLHASLSEGRDENTNIQPNGTTVFDTRRRELRSYGIATLGAHEFVIGGDYRDDVVGSTTAYDERTRDNLGVFMQGLIRLGAVDVQPALRWDDNEAYGSEVTSGLTLGWQLAEAYRLRAGVGTAFRAPSFNDLYFPGFGNPDVQPETSRSIEAGLTARHESWFWDVVAYQTDIDDLIAFTLVDGRFAAFNVAEARIRGFEAAAGIEVAQWTFAAAYTHLDPVNRDTGLRLPRRTRDSLRIDADATFGALSVGASSIMQAHRYNNAAATERLGGFGLLNLRAGWQISEDWSLRLTLDNALDKSYSTARDSFNGFDFQQPGRAAFLRVFYGQR